MLMDEQRQLVSYHEQFTHIPEHDCGLKYNIYLLYPHQPKNSSVNYSIQIDIFDKITLTYWASWHLSIPFAFLPVNRIATQLFIPNIQQFKSCSLSCGNHERCVRYTNKNSSYFCQCDRDYSGEKCDIKHICSCSSDAFCLASSICICPINKFDSKCYLKHSVCQSPNTSCQNNGLCIPTDDRIVSDNFTCLCKTNFYGRRCENKVENRIDIEFKEELMENISTVFVHFITALEDAEPQGTITLKKIKYQEHIITLYVPQPFHILFVELFNQDYYLAVVREKFIELEYIQTKLLPNQ
jgi:hypothetical protein